MSKILTAEEKQKDDFEGLQNSRLTKSSKAVSLLYSMFESGQLGKNSDPKPVWLSNPVFMNHKIQNFRTCFNNIKKEIFGQTVDEGTRHVFQFNFLILDFYYSYIFLTFNEY